MKRSRVHAPRPVAEISITPLLDLAFILLFAFVVAAPLMNAGDLLTPPSSTAALTETAPAVTATVTPLADGAVEWDGDRLPAERLAERAQQEIERRPDLGIILHVDASTPVQSLLPILRDLARAGVRHTAFQTAGPAHPTASPAP